MSLALVLTVAPVAIAVIAPVSWAGSVLGAAADGMVRPDALARLFVAVAGALAWLLILVTVVAEDILEAKGLKIDRAGFEKEMQQQRDRARENVTRSIFAHEGLQKVIDEVGVGQVGSVGHGSTLQVRAQAPT